MKNVWRVSEAHGVNWFAIGGGLAVALVGMNSYRQIRAGRTVGFPRTTAMIFVFGGLALAAWGSGLFVSD